LPSALSANTWAGAPGLRLRRLPHANQDMVTCSIGDTWLPTSTGVKQGVERGWQALASVPRYLQI
jgi:hypothetical protein